MADIFFGGGLNEQDEFNVSLDECTAGQNFRLNSNKRQFRPRAPQDLVGSTATNGGEITGLMQLIKRDDTQTQLVVADEQVYSWDLGSTFTAEATVVTDSRLRGTEWLLDQILVITDIDLQNPLAKWDGTDYLRLKHGIAGTTTVAVNSLTQTGGTATATATSHGYATDDLVTISGATPAAYNGQKQITVTGANTFTYSIASGTGPTATGTILSFIDPDIRAKYSVEFNGRMWLFNIQSDGTNTPHMILASAFEDAEDYDTATRARSGGITSSAAFFMFINDLKPINGVALWYDTIVVSTENGKLFRLVGQDALEYDFLEFYPGSSAAGDESFTLTGNDIHYMKSGGNIESFRSTERFGDTTADDISRWIPDTVDGLNAAIGVYDQINQMVFWFVSNCVLVYDKEVAASTELSPWSVYKTAMTNAFNTKAASYIRRTDNTWTVMWGDSAGIIYDMNGVGTFGDAGANDIAVVRTLRRIAELPTRDENIHGRVEYKRQGGDVVNLDLDFRWAEDYHDTTCRVPLQPALTSGSPPVFNGTDGSENAAYFGGGVYFNQGIIDTARISTAGYSPVGRSVAFTMTMNITTTVDFQVNKISIDE